MGAGGEWGCVYEYEAAMHAADEKTKKAKKLETAKRVTAELDKQVRPREQPFAPSARAQTTLWFGRAQSHQNACNCAPASAGNSPQLGGWGKGGGGVAALAREGVSEARASEGFPGRSCRGWSGWDGRGGASGAASPSLSPKPFRRRDPSAKRRAHGRSAPCARSLAICSEPPLTGSSRVFARA